MSIDFPKEELVIIEKWREIKAFERQVSRTTEPPRFLCSALLGC
jgi:isoleucyl-tRNA synthetase